LRPDPGGMGPNPIAGATKFFPGKKPGGGRHRKFHSSLSTKTREAIGCPLKKHQKKVVLGGGGGEGGGGWGGGGGDRK